MWFKLIQKKHGWFSLFFSVKNTLDHNFNTINVILIILLENNCIYILLSFSPSGLTIIIYSKLTI